MIKITEIMKKDDPDFKAYCEDTLKITREEFNNKIGDVLIDSETSMMEMIKISHFANDLWRHLKGGH